MLPVRITHFKVEGFRRFASVTTVRMDGSVIAVVGPNEAGKTSLLHALQALDTDDPLSDSDSTRDLSGVEPTLTAVFELDDEDRDALSHIPGGNQVRRCSLVKNASGQVRAILDPRPPHDMEPRRSFGEKIQSIEAIPILRNAHRNKKVQYKSEMLGRLRKYLATDQDPLPRQFFQTVNEVSNAVQQAQKHFENQNDGHQQLDSFVADLEKLRSHEESPPARQCQRVLLDRKPRLLAFTQEQRDLRPTYDLDSVVSDPPPPLRNLAALAGLELDKLYEDLEKGRLPQVMRACEVASQNLASVFSESWVRQDVVPVLSVDGRELHVFVRTPGGEDLSRFDERSDGFRWFVALVAFVGGQPEQSSLPILLIDEAETHLSYDAQGNLASTLAEQDVAQIVVYTTHSAACLPPDLGTGIRAVVPEDTGERSTLTNSFWHSGPGYTPLMLAMGASALAFTPARRVVVGEGPSECLLLPTLLREATGHDRLSFQIAPGLSNISEAGIRDVLSMAGEVAYLVDGDDGGDKLRNHLTSIGFPATRIVSYKDVGRLRLTLEDLVAPKAFAEAVNSEIKRWQDSDVKVQPGDIPNTSRMSWLDNWCSDNGIAPLNKPALAQRIVDLRGSHQLVDRRRRDLLRRLLERLEKTLDPGPASAAKH